MNHEWSDGGAYALLGPSGCGKTTLLNVISGLVRPTLGTVRFDGVDVTELPTERRNIAQVFQFPVIYDTMTVRENLGFPLRNRQVDAATIDRRVAEIADMLDLTGDLGRRARNLSADAKQKISLGRGLVRADVAAILFDEPLTVIDPHLKWQLRRKLKQVHDRYRLTMVYVTHDQNEALTFADQIVVMSEGRILQVGTPQELFERPAHTYVGYFIGSPGMNVLPCRVEGDRVTVDGVAIPLPPAFVARAGAVDGAAAIGVRPEFVTLVRRAEGGAGGVPVAISAVDDLGQYRIVTARLGGRVIKVKVPEDVAIPADAACAVFDGERTRLYADDMLVG
jgi:glycerol transport system ATP-binding protein